VSSSDPLNVAQALSSLAPGTTYHYRVVAANGSISTTGQDATFTTAAAPAPLAADIAVRAPGYPDQAVIGRPITYHFEVRNHGPATATNVVLRVLVPAGLRLRRVAGSQGRRCPSGPDIVCRLGSLAPGAYVTVAIKLSAVNTGSARTVAFATAAQADPTTANNLVSVRTAFVARHHLSHPARGGGR
jgi:uncharacterized repeat protein (TIGR01451 family)